MVDALLAREQELFKLNEQINATSPKLFNKNESFAIRTKNIDKTPIKVDKTTPGSTDTPTTKEEPPSTHPTAKEPKPTKRPKGTKSESDEKSKDTPLEVMQPNTALDETGSTTSSRATSSSSSSSSRGPSRGEVQTTIDPVPKLIERNVANKDNLIKFLKSKVAILQNELESAVAENQEMNQNFKMVGKQLKKAEASIEYINGVNGDLQKTIQRLENKIKDMEKGHQDLAEKLTEAKKDEANATSEVRKLKSSNRTLERRLHRAWEDLEATKNKLSAVSSAEREIRASSSHERASLETQVKDLKRDRMNMLNAFRKQLLQIDAMKKQNTCFDEAKLIEIAEQEYLKLLQWSNNNDE